MDQNTKLGEPTIQAFFALAIDFPNNILYPTIEL